MHKITLISFQLIVFLFFNLSLLQAQAPSFSQGELAGIDISIGVTSMMYGPDGRLYIAEYPTGSIKALTVQKNGAANYSVASTEILDGITTMADHNDDGTQHSSTNRQVTGMTVAGTANNPILYISSSDVRIGAGNGGGNGDVGLDTNSGVITRFTWNGGSWDVVDLVRGLPRSEENHATNGLELTTINGTNYLIVASGGFTNAGGPSANFVYSCEYALAGAVLSIDLGAINSLPILTDNGRSYIYDLPTLDDPTRANVNGITDADDVNYDGIDINDPFGGNDGLNQAMVIAGGPVQIFSPGYRNAYDLVVTQNGAVYVTDNGANGGWGGFPVNEGDGTVTNNYDSNEPGSQSLSGNEQVDNLDHLELLTNDIQNYVPGSFYAGHPNPTRANPNGAGLYTAPGLNGNAGAVFRTLLYDPDGSSGAGYTSDLNIALPANWPPVSVANPIEGDWRGPGTPNPDGPDDNPVAILNTNTNGIDEYTASNFGGVMQGDLLAGHSGGNMHRVQLNADGTVQSLNQNFLSGIGGNALGITCNGDTDIFPGTIWAGTLNGKVVVFEPADAVACINPGQIGYDANADYDNDGYTNQDEEDNGTDPCNGGSQPTDFDKVAGAPFISDLNDTDDDNDGFLDAVDPFQIGNPNETGSDAFALPVNNDLFSDQQGLGGIFGLGLTGLMNNGDTSANWLNWLDRKDNPSDPNPNDVLGGATGLMTSHMTSGTAFGATNTQEKGYQYGVQTNSSTGIFMVTGNLINLNGPLRLYENNNGVDGELGYFIGDGTQSNYIKMVLTTSGITALQEIDDVPQSPINISIAEIDRPNTSIIFYFVVDAGTGQVSLEYALDSGVRNTIGIFQAQGSILNAIQQTNQDLAVGFIGTSNTVDAELEGTWDFLNVTQETQNSELFVNAGGAQVTSSGKVFAADQSFVGGVPYSNTDAIVPELYLTERSSPSNEFQYSFPVENGGYEVILHFAEIFWGATGKPAGGIGKRIFDVSIEGDLVLDNYDIFADVGAETPILKAFTVNVTDGNLDIDFSSLPSVGGVDQAKISAIEIIADGEFPVLVVNPIVNQNNLVGDTIGSLGVSASGGDSNENFTYSISDQPAGVLIEPTNGLIYGTIESGALNGGPNSDGVHNVTVNVNKPSSTAVSITFDWTITAPLSCQWNDLADSNLGRFETRSEKIGDKLYVLGGWLPGTLVAAQTEIYDTTNDSWSFGAPMPIPVTHMGSAVVGTDIWIIGGFPGDNTSPGPAVTDVQIYNTLSNSWSTGPSLPNAYASGASTLNGNKIHYFGGLLADRQTDTGAHYVLDLGNIGAGWTTAASLPTPRNHHSAESVNGLVYSIGGQIGHDSSTQDTKLIHVYNPNTDQWTKLADLPEERSHFEPGTFVHNGKIIIVGGRKGNSFFNEVTEYDPEQNVWTELCPLPENLMAPVAQPFGDKLIVSSGGVNGTSNLTLTTRWLQLEPEVLQTNWVNKDENENYTGRHECNFVQVGDEFYLLGGRESALVERYNYTTDTWTQLGSAPKSFSHFQAIEYEGLIWGIGAIEGNNYPNDIVDNTIQIYSPLTDEWLQGPEIPAGRVRGAAGAVVYNDKFYIVGGNTNGHAGGYVSWFDEYDPATGVWISLADAPRARDHFQAVVVGDKLYATGGRQTGDPGDANQTELVLGKPLVAEVDVYDFVTGLWSKLPSNQNLPTPRAGAASVNFNDKIVVIGGEVYQETVDNVLTTDALKVSEEYDVSTGTWVRLDDLNSERHGHQALVSGNGIHVIAGSPNYKGGIQKNMEVYGEDNPISSPITQSTLNTPTDLIFDTNSVLDISLTVADGDTGMLINSMTISGPNAASFSIDNGELTKALIKADTSHNLGVSFNGLLGETAQLTISYGLNSQSVVALSTSVAEDLAFSHERGLYDASFDLNLLSGISGASIRYTTDGSMPSSTNGIIYNGTPLSINTTTTVRAIAYSGANESELATHSYMFLSDVIQQPTNITGWPNNVYNLGNEGGQATHDYEMDPAVVNAPEYSNDIIPGLESIPTMSIVMGKDDFWEAYDGENGFDGSVEIIYPNDEYPSEQFIAEVESHSHLRLKRSLKLDINNSITSNLLKTGPLYGDEATTNFTDTKFVLRAGNNRAWSRNWYPDKTAFTRDEWHRASQRAASGIGMPGTFVHLYVNGLYWGLYNPVQRQDAGYMAAYFGGETDDYMTLTHSGVKNGDPARFNYLNNTLVNQDMSIQANYEEVKEYIDVENFMDYLMIIWSMGGTDWPLNNFYGGNRNNPAEPFSYYTWDGEASWDINKNSLDGAWVHPLFESSASGTEPISKLWHSLRDNPEFMQLFVDRVNLQFFNNGPLSDNASRERWATVNQYIETAVIAESARWGDAVDGSTTRTKNNDWATEVARVDGRMNGNAERFIDALRAEGYYPALDAVVLNKPGGSVILSFELEMNNPNSSGTIYYTTDGSDPKLANGNISSNAITYNGPIAIPTTGILEIMARVKNGADWSANTEASYAKMELYINEFLASNDTGITDESGDLEDWIELYNAGVLPVDIGGMYITDDLTNLTQWQIPDTSSGETTIPPGEFLYVWADNNPDEGPLHVNIKLGAGGEEIGLSIDGATAIETIDSYAFGPQTADISTGRFPDGTGSFVTFDTPTPGAPNEIGFFTGIFINEFIAGNTSGITDEAGEFEDWIEIYNSNNVPVDIGGLYITDDIANPLLFQIPSDNPTATTIPAGGFIILWADDEPLQGSMHVGLKLGKSGEDIRLTQVIGSEQQIIDTLTYEAQSDDVSEGREPDGGSTFRFYFAPTPGSSNIIPFVTGLSINEVLALNSNSISDTNGENDPWIEVYNLNDTPVDIGGLYVSNNEANPSLWQIPNTNASLTTIPTGGFITLWADNQTSQGELHLPFTLSSGGGTVVISDIIGADVSTIDAMVYSGQANDVSFGRYPDASEQYKIFNAPTPNSNNVLPLISNIFINEFLAGNSVGITDEAGEFDDWIELYNGGTTSVDVGGLFIVDDLEETDPYQIPTTSPSETTILPGGFLLLWADKQPTQGVLHVGVKLSGGGEQIGLLQINGDDTNFIDSLTYLTQTDDISEGRSPDGGATFVSFTAPTPNASNALALSVTSLTLVDAISNEDIMSITDDSKISLSELPTASLNIRANTTNDVGSVLFDLTGALIKSGTESVEPYALYGDSNGSYNAQTFVLGTYTLNVTPYSAASLGGTQGVPFAITFEMVESTAPIANAGGNQNIILPTDSVILDGSGSTDPDGGDIAIYAWTLESGQTAAALSGASTAQLTASNLEEGDYIFRLTVTDDEGETDFDEVTVTVAPEGVDGIWLEAECAIVGSGWSVIDDAAVSNGQYLQTPAGTHLTAPPTDTSLWVTFEFQATAGPHSVHALAGVNSPADDSFWVRANGGTWIRWNKVEFSSTFVWDQVHDSDNSAQAATFNLVTGTNTIDISLREDGALLDKLYVTSTTDLPTGLGGSSSNCIVVSEPPVADAGDDQNITLPTSSVVLDGSSSNDPDGGAIVGYSWTLESGQTTATLSGASTAQLTASNLEEGDYVFRLTVTDNEGETDFDDVTVTVMGIVLLPPLADAGGNQNIILPTDSVILDGSGSTDPDGGDIAIYAWTLESGQTAAALSGASTAQLTASNLEEGDYIFRLTVTDDEGETDFDEVTVTVAPEGVDGIWLEAECAIVGSGWSVIDDAAVSNGQYLQTPAGTHLTAPPTDTSLWVTFEFQATAGPHSVHALAGVNSPADDSFWVRANGGTWIRWNKIEFSSTFVWDQVHDSDNSAQAATFNLVTGTNTIDISLREDGALLDKLYVTSTTDLPTGLGGSSSNCIVVSEPPVADAGDDQNITLPTSSVVLDGSSSNDPDGGAIVGYSWTLESGQTTATLSGASTAQLTASNLEEGDYVFRLTVTDDEGETDFDEVTVNVSTEVLNGVVWLEDFEDLSNGATSDNGSTAWTSFRDAGTFAVSNGTFLTSGNSASPGIWTSEVIPVSGTISLSVDVDDLDNRKEPADFVNVYYVLDGGPQVLFGSVNDDISPQTLSITGLIGSTIQIIVESDVSTTNEFYTIDNISVSANSTGTTEYNLTVDNGSGDGQYEAGDLVNIVADSAPSGQEFNIWIGDVTGVLDVNSPTTNITIPAANTTVTASYSDIPIGGVVWLEDFEDLTNGAIVDTGATAWSSVRDAGTFAVSNGTFLTSGNSASPGVWTSEVISVNGIFSISIDVDDADNRKEPADFVNAYYILDGGAQVLFGSVSDDISAQTFSITGLSGSTVQIIVEADVSTTNEFYTIDNITVIEDGGSTGKNSSALSTDSVNDISAVNNSQEADNNEEIYIYPNPASEYIGVRLSNANIMSIALYDLTGKRVQVYTGSALVKTSDGVRLPIASIGNGIYMLQIDFESFDTKYLKVVIQN